MADGPGEMHGLAGWLHHNEPSNGHTFAAAQEVASLRKLKAFLEKHPYLRAEAVRLAKDTSDPRMILASLRSAKSQRVGMHDIKILREGRLAIEKLRLVSQVGLDWNWAEDKLTDPHGNDPNKDLREP
jgi:hypothetical protein